MNFLQERQRSTANICIYKAAFNPQAWLAAIHKKNCNVDILAWCLQGKQLGINKEGLSESAIGPWLPRLVHGPGMFQSGLLLKQNLVEARAQREQMQPEIDAGARCSSGS